MPVAVAQRLDLVCARDHRTVEERAIVRFPGVYAKLAQLGSGLSPRSRFRQRGVARNMVSGYAAIHRGDFNLMLTRYSPTVLLETPPEFATLGMPARTEGRNAMGEWFAEFTAQWAEWRLNIHSIVDCGEQVITLSRITARGATSGAEVELDLAQLVDAGPDGLVSRERDFLGWPEGLAAADIDPGVLTRLDALPPGSVLEL